MGNYGKHAPKELKQKIVNMYLSGRSAKSLAEEYGFNKQTIYNWISAFDHSVNLDINPDDARIKIQTLQARVQELEYENEILKKATAILYKDCSIKAYTSESNY